MSNVQEIKIKPIPIVLDKPRTIVFDLNSFAELEEIYGSVQGVLDDMARGSIKALRLILWAGLIHEDDNLKPKDVGRLIQFGDVDKLTDLLNNALEKAQPTPEEAKNLHPLPKGAEPLKSEMLPMTEQTMDGTGDTCTTQAQSS